MKKKLKKIKFDLYHINDGRVIKGKNSNIHGDCSGLRGDCSGLRGNVTGLRGEITGLWGDCSGLWGKVSSGLRGEVHSGLWGEITGLRGNLDDCEITDEERKKGIQITDLVEDE